MLSIFFYKNLDNILYIDKMHTIFNKLTEH